MMKLRQCRNLAAVLFIGIIFFWFILFKVDRESISELDVPSNEKLSDQLHARIDKSSIAAKILLREGPNYKHRRTYPSGDASLNQKVEKQLENNYSALNKLRDHINKLKLRSSATTKPPESAKLSKEILLKTENILAQVTNVSAKVTHTIPVLMLAYNRPSVSKSLDLLLKYQSAASIYHFPIVVSQDGSHQETMSVIKGYGDKITYLQHIDDSIIIPPKHNNLKGYYKLSAHFKWAINQVFSRFPAADAIIIVEDDLEFAPDFFSYFANLHPLLDDPTILCVSAWNDNGKANNVDLSAGETLLYRSDFFPGLGWMLSKRVWTELEPKWPAAFWDDWLREPDQRKGRACIRPEICRTKTFGRVGVSNGQFFDKHLKFIKLNDKDVDWSKQDVSYLRKDSYDEQFLANIKRLPLVTIAQLQSSSVQDPKVKVEYSAATFKDFAKKLGIMDDLKSGVPRTAYRGVVTTVFHNVRVYLVPDQNWKGYT